MGPIRRTINLILALALAAAGICEDGTVNGSWSDGDLYAILTRALAAAGSSELAESVFHALEGTLRIFEKHRQLILDQLKRRLSE